MDNKAIIEKIKGLLKLANDNRNDEEGQSAFILAQRLMLKHKLNKFDLMDDLEEEEFIGDDSVTIYKRLYWWERQLATIISKNFRVKSYVNSKRFIGDYQVKRKIIFYGQQSDLELAKEMYILAYDAILHFSDNYLINADESYSRSSLKQTYIRGFLTGLSRRFEEQVSSLKGKYEVLVQVPIKVERAYDELSKNFGNPLPVNIPNIQSDEAFFQGVNDGKSIDFTKTTIDD